MHDIIQSPIMPKWGDPLPDGTEKIGTERLSLTRFLDTYIGDGVVVMDEITNLHGKLASETLRRELDTKERWVREALVRLGWTPPHSQEGMW